MNIRVFTSILAATLVGLSGCKTAGPVEGTRTECLSAAQPAVMEAARDVVTSIGFRLDKYDIEAGVLTTKPLSGSQFFEVWKGDNANMYDATEAAIHSLQRIVEMQFTTSDKGVCVVCDAKVRRLSIPEREIVGTTGAYSAFTKSSTSLMGTRLNPAQARQMAWIDMGTDGALSEKILERMGKKLGTGKGQPE
jgi:hypothetical protein